jgi:glycosyltransferase involved in cell wall biosynthesis|tara:strand:- start:830 stop:1582 length:753 start_codon:yes stop_codon:yes gene_type:complete
MKISIITVVKNDKKNLLSTIKSVLSQNHKNFEYIIWDGVSSDGTRSAVKPYLNKYIKYFCKKDKNYYEGLNRAIQVASGDYIGILNAGDKYFNPETLKKVSQKCLSAKCDLLFGDLIFVNNKNEHVRTWNYPIKKLNIFSSLKIASPTLFVKKKIAKSFSYNTDYNISSDTDFNIRISKKNFNFIYLDQVLILMKTGGLSTNYLLFFKKMSEDFSILKSHYGIFFVLIYLYKVFFKITSFKFFKKNIYNY